MSLAEEDIAFIKDLVEKVINDTPEAKNANVRYELDLRERVIRVEEELKHQRELMQEGFRRMDKRFEQVDKRFEQVDKRFEQVDKRIEQVDKSFAQVDKRFEESRQEMDKRFDENRQEMDKRFDQLMRRMDRFMFWSLGITVSSAVFVVNYLK